MKFCDDFLVFLFAVIIGTYLLSWKLISKCRQVDLFTVKFGISNKNMVINVRTEWKADFRDIHCMEKSLLFMSIEYCRMPLKAGCGSLSTLAMVIIFLLFKKKISMHNCEDQNVIKAETPSYVIV